MRLELTENLLSKHNVTIFVMEVLCDILDVGTDFLILHTSIYFELNDSCSYN